MTAELHYPRSDHYDGERFFNPGVDTDKGLRDLWRWRRAGGRVAWPARIDESAVLPPPPTAARAGETILTFIGQASVLIQVEGCNILTDPIFSDRASPLRFAGPRRARPPGVAFRDLPRIGPRSRQSQPLRSHGPAVATRPARARRTRRADRPRQRPGARPRRHSRRDRARLVAGVPADARRRGLFHAGPALVEPDGIRPAPDAVGRASASPRRPRVCISRATAATGPISPASARPCGPRSRSCRSAPTSPAGSWRPSTWIRPMPSRPTATSARASASASTGARSS